MQEYPLNKENCSDIFKDRRKYENYLQTHDISGKLILFSIILSSSQEATIDLTLLQ